MQLFCRVVGNNTLSVIARAREASPAGAKRPPAAAGRAVAIELHTTQAKKLHTTHAKNNILDVTKMNRPGSHITSMG